MHARASTFGRTLAAADRVLGQLHCTQEHLRHMFWGPREAIRAQIETANGRARRLALLDVEHAVALVVGSARRRSRHARHHRQAKSRKAPGRRHDERKAVGLMPNAELRSLESRLARHQ